MIELRRVTKEYPTATGALRILDQTSFTMEQGSFHALVGRSGTGKSTVLNLIGGLDRPNSGELLFEGVHLEAMDDGQLSKFRNHAVGFIFQTFFLRPMLSALDNVIVPLLFNSMRLRDARQRGLEALEEVGLADQAKKQVRKLSGGQRQRVAIARATVNRPKLLLADEPTGNLDTQTSLEIFELLRSCNARSTTVVVVTHDPLVEKFQIPMITIEQGQLVPYHGSI